MDFGLDIQVSDFAVRMAIATVCAVTGLTLLWLDRKPAVAKPAVASPAKLPVTRPALAPVLPRLTTAAAYDRLRARITEAGERTQRMNSCQMGAARQLDTAEVALRRLIDEISGVMPVSVSPMLVPRRAMPVIAAETSRPLAAAAA